MSMISEQIKSMETLIKAMRMDNKLGRVKCDGDFVERRIKIIQDAIDTIQTQGAKLAAYGNERSLQYYNNGWIPCEDKLPEEYGEYLCCDKYGNFIIGIPSPRYHEFIVETEYVIMHDCVAWMPLPESYKIKERS